MRLISILTKPRLLILFLVLITLQNSSAQERLPRFESTDCPIERGEWARDVKFECKWLAVPEARENPEGRTIKLSVVMLRAKEPDGSTPLVFLHGGPGVSGIRMFTRGVVEAKLSQHRDIVIYDQRGAGFSEPKLCPEYADVKGESQKLKTQKELEDFDKARTRKCITSLDARIDRAAYNTGESAADMIELRKVLGYSSWDVISNSYGGRLALEAMRRDPKGIRSVVLDKPVTRSPDREAEIALSNQHAFERVFNDCNNQPECRIAFPTLEKDFYQVYDDLNKTPLLVQTEQDSKDGPIVLGGRRFLDRIRNDVISPGRPERLTQLPLLLNEFRRGDKQRAAQILVGYNPLTAVTDDSVLINLITCYDVYGKELRAKRKAINAQVRAPFRRDLMEQCKLWQKQFAHPSAREPVRSDIPTLIFTGRYDDRTPTELAKRIASTLTRAYLYEFPNEAHNPSPTRCRLEIMLQFLANPHREPDGSCISRLQPIKFATTWDTVRGPQAPPADN